MTMRLVHRPTRITRPIKPDSAETIAAPPTITDGHVSGMPIQSFLPVIGALSSVIMIVVLRNNNPVFLVVGGVLLVVALIGGLAMALSHRGSAARTRRTQREHYLDFLEKLRARMRTKGARPRLCWIQSLPRCWGWSAILPGCGSGVGIMPTSARYASASGTAPCSHSPFLPNRIRYSPMTRS
jgi:hypothetical protein